MLQSNILKRKTNKAIRTPTPPNNVLYKTETTFTAFIERKKKVFRMPILRSTPD